MVHIITFIYTPPTLYAMNNQKTKTVFLITLCVFLFSTGVYAITFFTRNVSSNVKVVANGYSVTLYGDESYTTPINGFSFGELMEGVNDTSGWIHVWVVFDDNPPNQVWGHINTVGLPDGLILYGETYRYSSNTWCPVDVDNLDCDFGNDPYDDSYAPHLRFRVERTNSAVGDFDFTTIFTIMDSSTL